MKHKSLTPSARQRWIQIKPARGRSLLGDFTAGRSEPAIYLVTIALIALIALISLISLISLCVGALLIVG
ncbi:MAG: hypothetical protein F2872_02740 [Actinobacteria bacterium]|nr:hypothetical protein [Actinomycetota bacterium]